MLETPRLTLRACDPIHLLALIEEPDSFARVTGFAAADGLRGMYVSEDVSPDWLGALRISSGVDPWRHGFFAVQRDAAIAIGMGAFKGAPDAGGMVEIAYGIAPAHEGRGYATEVAAALTAYAWQSAQVAVVRAHTLPEVNASGSVLSKCGFLKVGTFVDPDDGAVWRWEQGRPRA